jgi:hypothetical protein
MKHVAGKIYLHKCGLADLDAGLLRKVEQGVTRASVRGTIEFDVVKIDPQGETISLLCYPEFFTEGFPRLRRCWTVGLVTGRVVYRTYEDSLNPPILHRKELLLPLDHAQRDQFVALSKDAEELGLFDDAATIGFREVWERRLLERGYQVCGNALVPLANEVPDSELPEPAEGPAQILRHRTALARSTVSAPVQALLRHELVTSEDSVFDYGCGRGDDIRALTSIGIIARGWDPH